MARFCGQRLRVGLQAVGSADSVLELLAGPVVAALGICRCTNHEARQGFCQNQIAALVF